MIIILKNYLWSFKRMCFVTKPMVELISFQFKKYFFPFEKHNCIIKQLMTGPSGNRLSICPLRFRIASPRVSIDRGDLFNLSRQIDLPITLETSHYLFNIWTNLRKKDND